MIADVIAAGAKPNVIKSAKESNSFPIGEDVLSNRAENPSKKSKTAPQKIRNTAHSKSINCVVETIMEPTPHNKLHNVMQLGICLFISNIFVQVTRFFIKIFVKMSFCIQYVESLQRSNILLLHYLILT